MEKEPKPQTRLKWILIVLMALLILIFIGQNWHPIIVNILGIKVEGRAFLVFAGLFAAGFLLGYIGGKMKKKKTTSTTSMMHEQGKNLSESE